MKRLFLEANGRTRRLIILTTLLASVSFLSYARKLNTKDLKSLKNYISDARKQWGIPGMSVGIIQNDQIFLLEGYGIRSVSDRRPVDEHTVFAIASNTKAMTATLVSMLAEEEKVSFEDPVRKYLPSFQLYDPWVSAHLNLTDLLCHRSGLATFSGDLIWYGSSWNRDEVIRRARYLKPVYSFRDGYGYSNIMFLTAGEVIGHVSGNSWDEELKYRILDPLDMNETSSTIRALTDVKNKVTGHTLSNGETVPVPWVNWDNIAPAGGVNSSASDMLKWIRFLLDHGVTPDGKRLIREASLENMWSIHNPQGISPGTKKRWPSIHFRGYGLGFGLMDYQGRKIISHGGAVDGQISRVVLVPEENLGFVILTNSNNSLPTYLMYEILDRFFGSEEKDWAAKGLTDEKRYQDSRVKIMEQFLTPKYPDTHPTLPLKSYSGTYSGKVYGDVEVVFEDEVLKLKFIPTPMFTGTLKHWQYDTFILTLDQVPSLPKGKVHFILDEDGNIQQMKINIPNPDFDFGELDLYRKKH